MNCKTISDITDTTYTNSSSFLSDVEAKNEAFYKRLKQLYPCVEDVSKLPQYWSTEAKSPSLGLTCDNLGCYFKGNGRRDEDERIAASVRTDQYIPPSCLIYYFEITFVSKGREGCMGLGLTSAQTVLTKLPGWFRESYGYHADDGETFTGDGRAHPFGPTFTTGDVIGCGFNLVEGKCFFTKNGLNLGYAFEDMPSNILFYPAIGLKTPGEEIRANFGHQDFIYDIEQDLRSLRKEMTFTISNYPVADFSDWQSTLHKLVQSWLIQNSYPDTAEAFSKSAKIECKENVQRIKQRNRIQQLVRSGKISEAIKMTNCLCPNLLQNNPNLLFALRCRQFIELISGAESDFQSNINFNLNDIVNEANGVQKMDTKGDQPDPQANHEMINNGCNGSLVNMNGDKFDTHQSTSASSQESMDIDQPIDSTYTLNACNTTSTDTDSSCPDGNPNNNHRSIPLNSITAASANNSNNNHSSSHQSTNKMDTNGSDRVIDVQIDPELDENEQKFARLLQFGRDLNSHLQKLDKLYGKSEANEKMLQEAIGLIAYTNPKNSCFGGLLDPKEREPICQLLNSSIVKAEMGDSYRLPLEDVVNHIRKLVRLNDSHGRWLVDRLY